MSTMNPQIHDRKNGLTYTLHGDYYLPNLNLSDADKTPIGRYGRMRMNYLREYRPGLYTRLKTLAYPNNPSLEVSSRFQRLQRKSKYIIGWLTINQQLDEPVAQLDNEFFLDHNANGQKNSNGAIFLDGAINIRTRPYTYVLYGHNMKSGAMFGCLRNFENIIYYHNDPFITFDTMYETGRYGVFAVGTVSTNENSSGYVDFFSLKSDNIQDRQQAINALISSSVHTCEVDVQPDDQLLILVTCVDSDDNRRVVAARRVRDGENETELIKIVERSRKR